MKIAVLGATGTVGRYVTMKLESQDINVVKASRSTGVDLITGEGLSTSIGGVHAVVDTSNPFPPDDSVDLQDALTSSTRNVVHACASEGIGHLVFLSIIGVENPVFDDFPYYAAKRAQEQIVSKSGVPATIVKSAQFHEFAINPAAVTVSDDEVSVQDWLIQPIAADTVAGILAQTATTNTRAPTKMIAGPQQIRLPELTTKLLKHNGDPRPVRTTAPQLPALGEGALLAPENADIVGPGVDDWLLTNGAQHTWQQISTDES